jgi:hypothetical protein
MLARNAEKMSKSPPVMLPTPTKPKPRAKKKNKASSTVEIADLIKLFENNSETYQLLDKIGGTDDEFNDVGEQLCRLIERARYLKPRTETDVALLVLLARNQIDLTIYGMTEEVKQDAAAYVEQMLISIMSFVTRGLNNLPLTRKTMWTESVTLENVAP